MKILMLLANPFKPDDRVNNEAQSLIKAGYQVKILAWDRELALPKKSRQKGLEIERFRLKSTYNSKAIIIPMIIFEIWLFFKILTEKFDFLHFHDFDTLVPGFWAGKIKGKKIIYDSHEDYGGAAEEFMPKWAVKLIHSLENFMTKHICGLVTPHPILIHRFKTVPAKALVMNCKVLSRNFEDQEKVKKLKEKLGLGHKFILMFTGAITRHRLVLETVKMLEKKPIKDLVFFMLGWSIDQSGEKVAKLADGKNIIYHPAVSLAELPLWLQIGDLNHCYQNPQNPNYKIAIPNKLFDAMTAKKPTIVAAATACAPIVKNSQSGFVLKYGDTAQLRKTLLRAIKNRAKIKKLGENGRQAVEKEYNWEEMAKRLVEMYEVLNEN